MTEDRIPAAVYDQRLPLEERRRLYAEWAAKAGTVWHVHPGQPWHGHPGGDRPHDHKEKDR